MVLVSERDIDRHVEAGLFRSDGLVHASSVQNAVYRPAN